MSEGSKTCPICVGTDHYEDGLYIRCVDCDHRLALTELGERTYEEAPAMLEALRALVDHCHQQEKTLTEELYRTDFCGESGPLTNARAILAHIDGDQ